MGFWGELKSSVNNYLADSKRKRIRWQEYKKLKLRIVGNLSLSELKKICQEYGIGSPQLYFINPLDDKKVKLGNPRDLYLKHVINKVSLDSLIDYSGRKRKPTSDILDEKRRIDKKFSDGETTEEKFEKEMGEKEEKSEKEIEKILKVTEGFDPGKIRDEKELENMLKIWFSAHLKGQEISTQYYTPSGNIDIMIDKKYGIELKLVERVKTLENLLGQISKYVDYLGKGNLAVILVVGKKISQSILDKWIKKYENMGSEVLVLEKGRIKRPKRKTTLWLQKR